MYVLGAKMWNCESFIFWNKNRAGIKERPGSREVLAGVGSAACYRINIYSFKVFTHQRQQIRNCDVKNSCQVFSQSVDSCKCLKSVGFILRPDCRWSPEWLMETSRGDEGNNYRHALRKGLGTNDTRESFIIVLLKTCSWETERWTTGKRAVLAAWTSSDWSCDHFCRRNSATIGTEPNVLFHRTEFRSWCVNTNKNTCI